MIYYNDTYYDDIYELLGKLTDYENDDEAKEDLALSFPDGITVQNCKEIPLHQFTESELWEILEGSSNWPEETEMMEDEVSKAIQKHLPALNADMPKVWVPNGEKTHYSLKELEEML